MSCVVAHARSDAAVQVVAHLRRPQHTPDVTECTMVFKKVVAYMGVCMSTFATNTNLALPTCGIFGKILSSGCVRVSVQMPHVGSAIFVLVAKALMQTPM